VSPYLVHESHASNISAGNETEYVSLRAIHPPGIALN